MLYSCIFSAQLVDAADVERYDIFAVMVEARSGFDVVDWTTSL